MDRQAVLFIALKGTRVLSVVDQDRLQFVFSGQVSLKQEDETLLVSLKSGGTLLPLDVCAFRHLFPL